MDIPYTPNKYLLYNVYMGLIIKGLPFQVSRCERHPMLLGSCPVEGHGIGLRRV